jgi:hypothetical protein
MQVRRGGISLHEGTYDISDAESFGAACRDIWLQMRERRLAAASGIGSLMERQEESVLQDLVGSDITIANDC